MNKRTVKMTKGRHIRIITAFVLAIIISISTGSFVFAEVETFTEVHYFKNDEVTAYLPRGSEVAEYDERDHIMSATAPVTDQGNLEMDVWYSKGTIPDKYCYLSNEEETIEYYNSWGREAIEKVYEDRISGVNLVSLDEPGYFDSSMGSYAVVLATVQEEGTDKQHTERIYINGETPEFDGVLLNKIIIFQSTAADYPENTLMQEYEEECINDLFDYTYAKTYVSSEGGSVDAGPEQQNDNGTFRDNRFWTNVMVFMPAIGALAIIAVVKIVSGAVRRRKEEGTEIHKHAAHSMESGWKRIKDMNPVKELMPSGKEKSEWGPSEEKLCGDFVPETDAEERYYQSLLTLRKSGLLTRTEMSEMLNKHAEVKARQQR